MRQWYFLGRMKSRANWDRHYDSQPYTTIWCTSNSKFNMSYFPISQLPTTQLYHHYFYFSIFKVGALFVSRNLCEPLHTSRHAATRSKGKGMFHTSLMDLCRIIFLFSDLITKEALIVLHNDDSRLFEMEAAPNNRNAQASLTEDLILEILHLLSAHSVFSCKCVCRS